MVDLRQFDARIGKGPFDRGGPSQGMIRTGHSGFDEHTCASVGQPGIDECRCIVEAEQTCLDSNTALDEQFAHFANSRLTLIGTDEVRQLGPFGDERETDLRIGFDLGCGAQRDRSARARGTHLTNRGRDRFSLKGLPAGRIEGVEVESTCCHGGGRLGGDGLRCPRSRRVVAITVEGSMQQRFVRR